MISLRLSKWPRRLVMTEAQAKKIFNKYNPIDSLERFVNEKLKILNVRIRPVYPNTISDKQVYKIRKRQIARRLPSAEPQ
jgi:hypothetical protein